MLNRSFASTIYSRTEMRKQVRPIFSLLLAVAALGAGAEEVHARRCAPPRRIPAATNAVQRQSAKTTLKAAVAPTAESGEAERAEIDLLIC